MVQIVQVRRIDQVLNEEEEAVERIRRLVAFGDLHAHLITRFDNPEDDTMSIDSSNDSRLQEKMPFEEELKVFFLILMVYFVLTVYCK
jgi:hypothetical protein